MEGRTGLWHPGQYTDARPANGPATLLTTEGLTALEHAVDVAPSHEVFTMATVGGMSPSARRRVVASYTAL